MTLPVDIDRAPVAPDGTTAGTITDFVLTFVDRDPAVDGISIRAGGTRLGHVAGRVRRRRRQRSEHCRAPAGPSTFGTSAVTGFDVGILLTTFRTDPDVTGDYTIHVQHERRQHPAVVRHRAVGRLRAPRRPCRRPPLARAVVAVPRSSSPDSHTNRQREAAISTLRPFAAQDLDAILDLSIRAWEPVFDSLEQVLGAEIFLAMHRDWRADQRRTVRDACFSDDVAVWVAEAEQALVGFVGIRTDEQTRLGEIYIIAVDPAHQRSGVATALMRLALDRLADAGMGVAMVETGGDAGHAPARELYRHVGFTLLPIARYFKKL